MPRLLPYGMSNVSKGKKTFDFQRELLAYCQNDVRILTLALIQFSNLIERTTQGLQCFLHTCTIAAGAMMFYRTQYLKENTIPVIPPLGFQHGTNQSKQAKLWLRYIEYTHNVKLQSYERGGEAQFKHFKVDGYDRNTRTVYEFYGCYYHGHQCQTQLRDLAIDKQGRSLNSRYADTMAREEFLRQSCNVNVVSIWECEWHKQVKTSPAIQTFLRDHCSDIEEPLCPKDAFKGGRTECFQSLYECNETEQIDFLDFTSLYPWVMATRPLPVGLVTVHKGKDMPDPSQVHGLVFCKVLPPTNLAIPILPYNAHNKLLFGLCRTCMETLHTSECTHTDEERAIKGVFCTPELHAALDAGYGIMQTYEIWESEMSVDLFQGYIGTFLKMKQEASGFPESCQDEDNRQQYIHDYFNHESIHLEYDNITKNEGLRFIAKIYLNSLFGKWAAKV